MIELACIFTTGGVILFYKAFVALKFDAIDTLIKKVLIQDRTGETSLFADPYIIKWKFANDLGLIFTIVYREMFHIVYIDELLDLMKTEYIANICPNIVIKNNIYKTIPNFDETFKEVMKKWELKQEKMQYKQTLMRSFSQTGKGKEITQKKDSSSGNADNEGKTKYMKKVKTMDTNNKDNDDNEDSNDEESDNVNHVNDNNDDIKNLNGSNGVDANSDKNKVDSVAEARKKLADKMKTKDNKKPNKKELQPKQDKPLTTSSGNTKKQATVWSISDNVSSSKMKGLDFSKDKNVNTIEVGEQKYLELEGKGEEEFKGRFLEDNEDIILDDDDVNNDKITDDKKPKKSGLFSKFSNSIKNITGNKILTAEDLEPILAKFKEDLMIKNVAEEIAKKLCESIKTTLIDKKTKAFTSINQTVKECIIESLTKILTPKRQIDIITEAMRAKEQGRPYVLVFIGVNGVGKSTNLAKTAYLLKNQGFSVMLAACDNFRAGAVEQIKTHGNCLKIPVYDRGYKDDPANIAHYAIREATQKKIDCVLIDTAGRMQDNEPLMTALSKLIVMNQPDLIIFVGEALVGNDAVDQLTKFNKSLIDLSPKDNIREIDAILLTKFDTVDEKVGAAISMTYTTGKPVIFVGVGQKYTHLKKLNVNTVVNALLN